MTAVRYASVIGVPPETVDRYEELHRAVPPQVLAAIARCNITNYSIYRHGDLLFSYFEYTGADYEADAANMAADPATQAWWALCTPLQVSVDGPSTATSWKPIPELFHVD